VTGVQTCALPICRLVMHDTSEKLKENPDIRDFYLGLSDIGERKSFRQVKHYKRRKRWLT
jgi:branched-chain amino acid transport system ATP-binding protein